MPKVGVLALQGAFIEHMHVFQRLGAEAFPVRLPQELTGLDGLVIPGGESTTITKLMASYNFLPNLRRLAALGVPILGTCAGMIVMAKEVDRLDQQTIACMDIRVKRNAFGRQVDSFEADLSVPVLGEPPFHAVFIRAPYIEKAGPGVDILARLEDGTIVAAQQGSFIALSFHPELTQDTRFHQLFLSLVDGQRSKTEHDRAILPYKG